MDGDGGAVDFVCGLWFVVLCFCVFVFLFCFVLFFGAYLLRLISPHPSVCC